MYRKLASQNNLKERNIDRLSLLQPYSRKISKNGVHLSQTRFQRYHESMGVDKDAKKVVDLPLLEDLVNSIKNNASHSSRDTMQLYSKMIKSFPSRTFRNNIPIRTKTPSRQIECITINDNSKESSPVSTIPYSSKFASNKKKSITETSKSFLDTIKYTSEYISSISKELNKSIMSPERTDENSRSSVESSNLESYLFTELPQMNSTALSPPFSIMNETTPRSSLSCRSTKDTTQLELLKAERMSEKIRIKSLEEKQCALDIVNRDSQKSLVDLIKNKMNLQNAGSQTILKQRRKLPVDGDDVLNRYYSTKDKNTVLCNKFNIKIKGEDLKTLMGLNWLNDEIMNFYLELIMERSVKSAYFPKVHCFSTFFYPNVLERGHSAVKRWTRKIDIFSYNFLIVPVHLDVHWCMCIIDIKKKEIRYHDSMGGEQREGMKAMLQYLQDESLDKKKVPLDVSEWCILQLKDIPRQENCSDCGVFACAFAEYTSREEEYDFCQEDMPYFRKKMIYEILELQLVNF